VTAALVETPRWRQIARRLGWGVADQAVSSLENFLLGVYVAKFLGAESLGALALAFVAYGAALNGSRALSTDPLVIRYSAVEKERWRRGAASSSGVALLVGVLAGALCLALGAFLRTVVPDSETGSAFIALGIVLPGLTLQDSWRYAFFAAGEGAKTFLNDAVWTVLLCGVLLLVHTTGHGGIMWALLAFGGTATLAGLFGMLQARTVPRPRAAPAWLRQHKDLGPRFLVENLVLGTGGQIRPLVVAVTTGLAAVGAIRGAEMLIGPVYALLMGVGGVSVPEAARALRRSGSSLWRLCLGLSLGLASAALAWGAFVLVVFPLGLGEALLGALWSDAYPLVLAVTLSAAAGCMHIGPSSGLRALGRADKTMRTQLIVTFIFVLLGSAGAVVWDAPGAVWGTAVAAVLGAGIWWSQFRKAQREHLAAQELAEVDDSPRRGADVDLEA
jgi:O-antigen/teichoic acid export membrane protein